MLAAVCAASKRACKPAVGQYYYWQLCGACKPAHVSLLEGHAGADGALEAFVSVITGPPGQRPEAIFDNVEGPLLVLWGKEDSVTALDGPVCCAEPLCCLCMNKSSHGQRPERPSVHTAMPCKG